MNRLHHDAAWAMTKHCIELLSNLLDAEQKIDAQEGIYAICLAGLEAYEVQVDRMRQRLRPLEN